MKNHICIFTFLLAASILFISCKTQNIKPLTLEDQLKDIMDIWPGTYSNDKQIKELKKKGIPIWRLDDSGKDGYLNIKSHYIKLDAPQIAEHVLYVEEYRDNDPTATYRQRIYTLSIDDQANLIRVKLWPFKDKEKYIGSWRNPSDLNKLSVEEISAFPAICDLLVQRQGDKYYMPMNGNDCTFGNKTFNYQVMLSKDMFSYRDKITDKDTGEIISTAGDYNYHDLDRID